MAKKQIAEAQALVADELIDPTSPLFSDVTIGTTSNEVCGWVNGKNRLGAYAGEQRFYVIGTRAQLESQVEEQARRLPDIKPEIANSGLCAFDREFRICKGEQGVPDPLDCLLLSTDLLTKK